MWADGRHSLQTIAKLPSLQTRMAMMMETVIQTLRSRCSFRWPTRSKESSRRWVEEPAPHSVPGAGPLSTRFQDFRLMISGWKSQPAERSSSGVAQSVLGDKSFFCYFIAGGNTGVTPRDDAVWLKVTRSVFNISWSFPICISMSFSRSFTLSISPSVGRESVSFKSM